MQRSEIKQSYENLSNYPFVAQMVFCSRHSMQSDVIEVVECKACHAPQHLTQLKGTNYIAYKGGAMLASEWFDRFDPFATSEPCWRTK